MPQVEEFLASVLPPDGPYVLAFRSKGASAPSHKVVTTFATLIKSSKTHAEIGADSWVCIGSILDKDFKNQKGDKSPRNQKNIKAIKSLIFDLDVNETKPGYYSTKEDAMLGLYTFQQALGLPSPTVVDSGYGFHVWWPFSGSVEPHEWYATSQLLKGIAAVFDRRLIADGGVRVCDSASLLRVPDTLNYKGAKPVPTSVLGIADKTISREAYHELFEAYIAKHNIDVAIQTKPQKEKKEKDSPVKNMLSLFLDEPHDLKIMLKRCNWLKHYATHQAEASEPEWYATLGVVPYVTTKGKTAEDIAHILSSGHPGYSPSETEKKLRQVTKAQDGPTTCDRFRLLNSVPCRTCPYAPIVNTPVRLDMVDLPAPAPIVTEEVIKESGEIVNEERQLLAPPSPYFRGKDGPGIYMRIGEGDEQTVKRIYDYDIYPTRRLKDEETDNEMLEISLTLPMDGHRFIKIANGLLTDAKKLTAELANKGVLVQTREAPSLTGYIIDYARKIQREEQAHEEFARFGWRDIDGDNPRFVLGDFVLNSRGDLRRATPAPYLRQVREAISVKGSLDEWRKGFGVYEKIGNSEPLKFALMMAFAAPLLALTEFNGMIYSMLGESGCGKTTALKLMSSVWGKPNEGHIKVNDNAIPMYNTLGYLQSIPVTFDEMTTMAAEHLADLAYNVTGGRGKNRADRGGNTRQNTTHWKTIICGTSNASLYEKLGMSRAGNNAHAYRIFEVNVSVPDVDNRAAIDAALLRVGANHGLAGRIFITHVLKNLASIKGLITATSVDFATRFKMPTAERFWFILFSCMAVGGKIAQELGLHNYDVEEIVAWNALQLTKVRNIVSSVEGDAFSHLSHFLQTHLNSTLIVKDNKHNALDLMTGNVRNLLVRLEYQNGAPTFGFIAMTAMKDYCKQTTIEYGWLTKRLEDTKILLAVENKALGEGTNMLTGIGKCWKIDLQHPMFQVRAA